MKVLTYYADPMCSWCWGFAPQIAVISAHFGARLPILPVMGGLRAGTTVAMNLALRSTLQQIWRRVAEMTGQPFDFGLFAREAFIYDTEPACRAVVAVRTVRPGAAMAMLAAIQAAFYRDGRDTTSTAELAGLGEGLGVARADFLDAFESDSVRSATVDDFLAGARVGVVSFPTLVAEGADGPPLLVTSGFCTMAPFIPALEEWLDASRDASPRDDS